MKWKLVKISSFTDVVTGGTPSTTVDEYWEKGTLPWLNSGDLNKGEINEASNFITELGLKYCSTKIMPPNTVLIALTGATTGVTAILNIDACANQSVTGILPSEKHNSRFLYYFLKSQREKILRKTWGGAQPHINQKYVKDFVVPLPPLNDQSHLANILTKAENLITQRKASIRLLDEYLKSTFLEMFGDPVKNEKSLTIIELGKLGNWKSGGTPSRKRDDFFKGNIIWITSGELNEMFISDSKEKITKEAILNSNASEIQVGSLLLGMYDTAALKSSINRKISTCNQAIAFAKLNESLCNSIYIFHTIQLGKDYFRSQQRGVRQKNMNLSMIKGIKIILPPIEEQSKFAQLVEKTESIKDQYKKSLQELENLYGSLSQKAFRGELSFNNEILMMAAEPDVPYSKNAGVDQLLSTHKLL